MPLSAMCGRLRVGKKNLHVAGLVGAAMCSAFRCGHMTAGHNAPCGSGPGQNRAFDDAMAQVGCPDRRIDRSAQSCWQAHIAATFVGRWASNAGPLSSPAAHWL
jgi:hypothetical protein